MGLMSFVKAAGEALGFIDGAAGASAEALRNEVAKHGHSVDGLDIAVDGDTVTVSGAAATQEVREKVVLTVGNVAGVAAVEDAMTVVKAAPDASGGTIFHTVASGDTLWAIAQKHLGDGSKYPHIFEANRPMLTDPDKIYPGQVLRIPAA